MLLPNTPGENAGYVAERVRRTLSGTRYTGLGLPADANITISVGVATCPRDATDLDTLMELADKALYVAKADGRDRFVVGSIGPGTRLPSLGHVAYPVLEDSFAVQCRGLIAGGVDAILIETCQDTLQIKAAVNGAKIARREAGTPNDVRGALVTSVDQDSNAGEAGLRAGDVIVEINRQAVRSADDAVTLSEKAKTDRIRLRVWRGGEGHGGMLFLSVDNTKKK